MGRVLATLTITVAATASGLLVLVYAQRSRRPVASAVCVLKGAAVGTIAVRQYNKFLCFGGFTKVTGVVSGLRPGV